jgi:D-inositol-3-phosphate glycosyltransferase
LVLTHNRKKILIIGPAFPLRGGLATYNERLALAFKEQGHSCDILSFSLQYPSFLFPGKTQLSTDEAPEGINIDAAINSINPFNWLLVGRKYQKAKYDVVVFRYWMSFMAPAFGTIARIIAKNKHSKILAITDNVIPHEQRFFDTAFTKYFLSGCRAFLTMSEAVKQDLHFFNQDKLVAYVPHPMYDTFGPKIDKTVAKNNLKLDTNTKYVLFFGFVRAYKGLRVLLEAFADSRIRELGLKLIVAGEFYEDKQPYLQVIDELNLQNQVILSNDFIPNNEVSQYFCAADLVVQPYLHATQSGVTQIAYYYNKPMVVTNVGGLAELVPNNVVGYVTEVSSLHIADAMFNYFTLNKEQTFSLNMEQEKLRFTWENLCNSLLNLAKNG